MAVIFILEVAAGVAGFVINGEVYSELQMIMNGTISMYNGNQDGLGTTWDTTQVLVSASWRLWRNGAAESETQVRKPLAAFVRPIASTQPVL